MKKLNTAIALLFSFLIQKALTQSNETDYAVIAYGYLKEIFAGMVKNESGSLCLQVVNERKNEIIEHLRGIIDSLSDIDNRFTEFGVNLLKLLTLKGYAKNCKILNFVIFYNKLTNKDEIIKLGNLIYNTATELSGIFNRTNTNTTFFKNMGKLAKKVLDIKVK